MPNQLHKGRDCPFRVYSKCNHNGRSRQRPSVCSIARIAVSCSRQRANVGQYFMITSGAHSPDDAFPKTISGRFLKQITLVIGYFKLIQQFLIFFQRESRFNHCGQQQPGRILNRGSGLVFLALRKSGFGALKNLHCLSEALAGRVCKFQPRSLIFSRKRHSLEFLLLLLQGKRRNKNRSPIRDSR